MKIKYDLEKNYFNLFNEAQGIVTFKKDILKKTDKKVLSYTGKCLSYLKIILIISIFTLIFYFIDNNSFFTKTLLYLLALIFGLLTIMVVVFIAGYQDAKKRKNSGEIQFSKNGILDVNSEGIKIGLPWNYIDFVVITDHVICILTKAPFFFFFDKSVKEDVLGAIMKYAPNLKIINQETFCTTLEEKSENQEEGNKKND